MCPAYCQVRRKMRSCSSRATDGSTYQSQGIVLLPATVAIGVIVACSLGRDLAAGSEERRALTYCSRLLACARNPAGGPMSPAPARGSSTLARMRGHGHRRAEVDAAEIAAAVAAEAAFMEDVLCRLIEAPTTLGNEEPGQEVMRDALREIGLEPFDMPLDEEMLRAHPAASPFSWDISGKRNVVADWQPVGDGGRSLVLNGHIDVVAEASSLWRTAPYTPVRDGDWVYGRGAGDMKAGLAVILGAVKGLRALGLAPSAHPCSCSRWWKRSAPGTVPCRRPSAACAPTPASSRSRSRPRSRSRRSACCGSTSTSPALSAHAGDARDGANAIEASFPVVAALRRLETELNESPPPPYDACAHPINLNVGVDPRRRLALDRRCRVHTLVPPRALPGAAGRLAAGEDRGDGRGRGRDPLLPRRASPARSLRRASRARAPRSTPHHPLVTTLARELRGGRGSRSRARADDGDDRRRLFLLEGIPVRLLRSLGGEPARGRRTRQHPFHDHRRAGPRRLHPRLVRGGGDVTPLRGISEIRRFFRTNETPIWFVSATPFNLLGIDRWVRSFCVPQLLRLVRRPAPERVRAEARGAADLRFDRGDLQLPARAQGGRRPRQGARAAARRSS